MNNKISAEEKHYIKLNTKLRQEWNRLNKNYESELAENYDLRKKISTLEDNIVELEKINKILVDNSGLSVEEVRRLIKTSELANRFVKMSGLPSKYAY